MDQAYRDSQLNLLWTSRMDFLKDQRVDHHSHEEYYQLFLFLSGSGIITYDEREISLQSGHYYLVNRQQSHSFQISQNSMTLDFKFKLFDAAVEKLIGCSTYFGFCGPSDLLNLKQIFKLALMNMNHPALLLPYMIDTNFKAVLLSLINQSGNNRMEAAATISSTDLNGFAPVRYLRENYDKPVTVEGMSRHLGFHPTYLTKLFKDKTGMTPIAYLQQFRLDKACEALEFTNLSIEQIAESIGFTIQYFSKLFHVRKGMTPNQYRQYMRNAINVSVTLEDNFQH